MVHNTEKSQLSFSPKRVLALTTVGSNHQNTENILFWWPFLFENQVFIKKWKCLFSLLSPDVLHYFWTKNHKNTSKCTLCPQLHPKSDFQFTKKENTPGKRSLYTTFEFKLYFFIILSTFLISFWEGLLYQSYRNHVLNDFEMLSLGQKILKDQ